MSEIPAMRRKDRLVTDPEQIYDILSRCDVIRLAMNTGAYPYVIPLTFGCELKDGQIVIYFHCAWEGRKLDLLRQDPRVCVEADLYYQVERRGEGSVTARDAFCGCLRSLAMRG